MQSDDIIFSSSPLNGAQTSPDGSLFTVNLQPALSVPANAKNVKFRVAEASIWNTVPNVVTGANDVFRITGPREDNNSNFDTFTVLIPKGLYDLRAINDTIQRSLQDDGARQNDDNDNPLAIVFFQEDPSTSKVVMYLPYPGTEVDFGVPNSVRDILGFDAYVETRTEEFITAQNVAAFNNVNGFLIHCDLVDVGIMLNSRSAQIVAAPSITAKPGSLINYAPFNPPALGAQQLAGQTRSTVTAWLTDERNRRVDTAGENFSFRCSLSWQT